MDADGRQLLRAGADGKMVSFGNELGVDICVDENLLFDTLIGSIVVETTRELSVPSAICLGTVTDSSNLLINGESVSRDALYEACTAPFAKVYPATVQPKAKGLMPKGVQPLRESAKPVKPENLHGKAPIVYIPVFPGTNCDYDSAKAWRNAGAEVETTVFRNLTDQDVIASIDEMVEHITRAQILMLAGGFSLGDEPDGSAKFIVSVLNQEKVSRAVEALLARGGLILGICNGFQALVKSGLLPYGHLGMVDRKSVGLSVVTMPRCP